MQPVLPFILQEPLGSTPPPQRRPSLKTIRHELTRIVSPAPNDDPWPRGSRSQHRGDAPFAPTPPSSRNMPLSTSPRPPILPLPQATTATCNNTPNIPPFLPSDSSSSASAELSWLPCSSSTSMSANSATYSSSSSSSSSLSSLSSASYSSMMYGAENLVTEPVRFRCDQCTDSFASNGALKKHKYTHLERNFRCHCGLAYTTMSVLRKHQYIKGCGPSPTSAAWSQSSGSSSPESRTALD